MEWSERSMINKRNIILLIILLLFLGMVYAPPKTLSVENYAGTLSPKNTGPLGTSKYVELLKRQGYRVELGGPDKLDRYGSGDIYILLGPDKELSKEEIWRIKEFISRGGSILIADELGTVNNLLKELFDAEINSNYLELYFNKYANPQLYQYYRENSSKYFSLKSALNTQIAIVPRQDKLLHFEPIGNNTPPETKETFLALLVPKHYKISISGIYIMYPSLSSYIGKLGELDPRGYILTIDHTYLESYESTGNTPIFGPVSINHSSIYVYSAQLETENYRAYVIADTSIFTNQYLEMGIFDKSIIYIQFHKDILRWLSKGFRKTVIFDDTHIVPQLIKQPMPHLGRMMLDILVSTSSTFIDTYNNFLSGISLLGLTFLLILWIPSTYVYLKRRVRVREIKEREPEEVLEKLLVYKSEVITEIGKGALVKRRYKELINGLYDLINYILTDKLSITIREIAENKAVPKEKLSKYEINSEELVKLCSKLEKLKRKIDTGSFLPIILSWNWEIKRIIREADNILVRLGYGFISSDVERGIEDVYK